MILLKTVDLSKQFGETRACDNVNFVVHKGEFLSLVGSNGAGKTSLVNLISAHLKPDSGQILFEDRDITSASVHERIKAGIARSFQIVNLFDGLSVFDNVALSIFSRDGKTVEDRGAGRPRPGRAQRDLRRARPVRSQEHERSAGGRAGAGRAQAARRRRGLRAAPQAPLSRRADQRREHARQRRRSWTRYPRSCAPGR